MNILDFARKAVISVGVALCVGFSANTAMAVDVTQYEHTNQEYFDNLKATIQLPLTLTPSGGEVFEQGLEFDGEVAFPDYLYAVIKNEEKKRITGTGSYRFVVPVHYFNIDAELTDQLKTYLLEFQLDHPELLLGFNSGRPLVSSLAKNTMVNYKDLPEEEKETATLTIITFDVEIHGQEETIFDMMETKMTELVDYTKQFNPGVEQLLMLHNKIIEDYEYDYEYKEHETSPYQFFTEGNATCVAYSSLFNSVLNKLGYNTTYIFNKSHIWSAVELDGEWYNVDVTWDEDSKDSVNGYAQTEYFLVPDSVIEKRHEGPYFKFEEFTADSEKYMSGYLFNLAYHQLSEIRKTDAGWSLRYKYGRGLFFSRDIECSDGYLYFSAQTAPDEDGFKVSYNVWHHDKEEARAI